MSTIQNTRILHLQPTKQRHIDVVDGLLETQGHQCRKLKKFLGTREKDFFSALDSRVYKIDIYGRRLNNNNNIFLFFKLSGITHVLAILFVAVSCLVIRFNL